MVEYVVEGPRVSQEIFKNMQLSLSEYFLIATKNHRNKILMVDAESGESITCAEIIERSFRIAKFLKKLGCKKGTVVAVASENRLEFPCILFGIILTGATCTCVHPLYTTNELLHAFNISKPKIVFTYNQPYKKLVDLQKSCDFLQTVINIDTDIYTDDNGEPFDGNEDSPCSTDVATIMYSSGTTGLSKGVMLTHESYIFLMEIYRTEKLISFPEDNVIFGLLPVNHAYGMYILLSSIVLGHSYILVKRYSEKTFLEYIEKYRINTLYIVPPIIVFLARNPCVLNYDLSSVKYISTGGAPISKDLEVDIRKRINSCTFLQHYGLTETTTMCLASLPNSKPGTTGRLLPGMSAKIIALNDSSVTLGRYERGELCVKGPLLMKGYCGISSADNDAVDAEGWLHTGDVAYYDDDHDFYIVDRIKELIKYKGFQVPPAELESLLLQHEAVHAVGVVGVPDDEAGELPRAYIVIKPGYDVTEKEIEQFVAENLSPPKKLRGGVKFVKTLPQTSIGKIDRKELKKWARGG